jgi:hypothetical protein
MRSPCCLCVRRSNPTVARLRLVKHVYIIILDALFLRVSCSMKGKSGFLVRVFQKELDNGIPNFTVRRLWRKHLHLEASKWSIVQHLERWIVCTSLSVTFFVTLATQWHLKYHCKTILKYLVIHVKVTLNHNYPMGNSVYFATLQQLKILYMYSE